MYILINNTTPSGASVCPFTLMASSRVAGGGFHIHEFSARCLAISKVAQNHPLLLE
jgi:hypothetical protein